MASRKKNSLPNIFDDSFYEVLRSVENFFDKSMQQLRPLYNHATIPIDISETSSEVVVEAQLAGYNKDQIKVDISGNQIWISAEKKEITETIDENSNHYYKEQSMQKAERSVTLPFIIADNETTITYQNGTLKIVTPKKKHLESSMDNFWM
ncbi:Hsp20/alpha crystallin family protein [Halobacillus sp. MO56]